MKFLLEFIRKKLYDFAGKREVKHISISWEPSILFNSLVNLVDSEDITMEKNKTQELFLPANTFADSLQTDTIFDSSKSSIFKIISIHPEFKSQPNKNYYTFCRKKYSLTFACFCRLNLLKERPQQSKSPTLTFNQFFKDYRPQSNHRFPNRQRSRSYSN